MNHALTRAQICREIATNAGFGSIFRLRARGRIRSADLSTADMRRLHRHRFRARQPISGPFRALATDVV